MMLRLSLKRRLFYVSIVYLTFLAVLVIVELGARLTLPHISSLDLFVVTTQQKAQVANAQQSGIFEGDPLLLWRLKPNMDHVVWDYTVVSTNAQNLRANRVIKAKAPGTIRIVCLGDSVTFGYRVPPVWPEQPTDYDPAWLPFPMLLEQSLRVANPAREVEVIAMAVPGYTSYQGLAWLRRDIDTFKPDILIVSFGWNDVSLSEVADREIIGTSSFVVAARWLVSQSQAFAHAQMSLSSWNRASNAASNRKRQVSRVSEKDYLDNMTEIIKLAREREALVIALAAPYRDNVTNPREAALMVRYRMALRAVLGQERTAFLEVPELTEAAFPSNQGWFDELIHPNHMGHRLIASELLELLSAEHLTTGLTIPTFAP